MLENEEKPQSEVLCLRLLCFYGLFLVLKSQFRPPKLPEQLFILMCLVRFGFGFWLGFGPEQSAQQTKRKQHIDHRQQPLAIDLQGGDCGVAK